MTVGDLEVLALQYREMLLRLSESYPGAIHLGGDLSSAEILTVLFHYELLIDPEDHDHPLRDRFILSKGHGAVGMYLSMAQRGFFDVRDIFEAYGQLDSAFGMHPCKVQLPGVEASTGSLGHGLPISVGLAASARQQGDSHRVFCLMGDGETGEGSVWEGAMAARSNRLGNLVALVDRNRQLMTSHSEDRVVFEPYPDKWRSFGWNVLDVDGHNLFELVGAMDGLPSPESDRPTVIICNTVKGKGIDFMEGDLSWHAGSLDRAGLDRALAALYRTPGFSAGPGASR